MTVDVESAQSSAEPRAREAAKGHITYHHTVVSQQVALACSEVVESHRRAGLARNPHHLHLTGYFTVQGTQIVAGFGAPGCETPVITINIAALLRDAGED